MQVELRPAFPGPVALRAVNPAFSLWQAAAALALAGTGIGSFIAGRRIRQRGRLICAKDRPIVGVQLDYQGDWWADRGKRLYQKARRAGARTGTEIAKGIIEEEVGSGSWCMGQFPPHAGTESRNVNIWDGLMAHVTTEMVSERG